MKKMVLKLLMYHFPTQIMQPPPIILSSRLKFLQILPDTMEYVLETKGKHLEMREKEDYPLSMYLSDVYAAPTNLAGIPGISIPTGFINDLPVGMQILGPKFSEKLLFNVGHTYEIAHKWYERTPNER